MISGAAATVIFDTDILIWLQRRHQAAIRLVDETEERLVAVQSYMEFLQGAQSPKDLLLVKDFLKNEQFNILPLSENIGHRASIYIEEYAVQSGLRAGDALIAATAVEHNLVLATGNRKHFQVIKDLKIHAFRP